MLNDNDRIAISVERASNDLRKGFPVLIDGRILVASPETISEDIFNKLSDKNPRLILTANRAKFIYGDDSSKQCTIDIKDKSTATIAKLAGLEPAEKGFFNGGKNKASAIDEAALQLVKIAELIPCAITFEGAISDDILSVSSNDIAKYPQICSHDLIESCRTKLVLKHSIPSEIIAYRPKIGGKEHYAIIIGEKLPKNPITRIHSSCYTGDLLDSLACDCHDQLHSAIELMHKQGGGVILYMLQEGRGIGLINKLRAYAQKELGMDTVDANESLGFDDDERLFEPAATILKELNIKTVRLLTNNPRKAKGLEDCGITVSECVPHIMEANIHNEKYLKTKSDRLGHNLDAKK